MKPRRYFHESEKNSENDPNLEKITKPVDFDLLVALTLEYKNKCATLQDTIAMLAMSDIEMSEAVTRLGVACGILCED